MFNFHHHNPQIIHGIYNLDSKSDVFNRTFSAGLHPYDIHEDWQNDFEALKIHFENPNCVAIGETGLDGRLDAPTELQTDVFLKHIEAANRLCKPVIIHCVKRFQDIIHLKKYGETPWIIHGFNKNQNTASQLLSHGFYLSFGKALLHNLSLQQIFRGIPADRFFLETDDSDIKIEEIYQKAAELKQVSTDEIETIIAQNIFTITDGAMA